MQWKMMQRIAAMSPSTFILAADVFNRSRCSKAFRSWTKNILWWYSHLITSVFLCRAQKRTTPPRNNDMNFFSFELLLRSTSCFQPLAINANDRKAANEVNLVKSCGLLITIQLALTDKLPAMSTAQRKLNTEKLRVFITQVWINQATCDQYLKEMREAKPHETLLHGVYLSRSTHRERNTLRQFYAQSIASVRTVHETKRDRTKIDICLAFECQLSENNHVLGRHVQQIANNWILLIVYIFVGPRRCWRGDNVVLWRNAHVMKCWQLHHDRDRLQFSTKSARPQSCWPINRYCEIAKAIERVRATDSIGALSLPETSWKQEEHQIKPFL